MNSPVEPTSEQLFDAISNDDTQRALLLLEANPALLRGTRIAGRTPLHQASLCGNLKLAEHLVSQGANVNSLTEHGWSPLFYACAPLDDSIAILLIESGCDVTIKNEDGFTALHLAADLGKIKIAALIIEKGGDIGARDNDGETPLDYAKKQDWHPMIAFLQEHGARD